MQCTSSCNPKALTLSIERVIESAARLCICPGHAEEFFGEEPLTLYKFCRLYRNYNSPSGFSQCISAKLTNQCYSTYYEFKAVIDREFGADVLDQNSYLYTVCSECNGSNENCQFPVYNIIYNSGEILTK